jgi:hypothetical protein
VLSVITGVGTKAGEVRLRIPKLRMQTFETAIIERYWLPRELGRGSLEDVSGRVSGRGHH